MSVLMSKTWRMKSVKASIGKLWPVLLHSAEVGYCGGQARRRSIEVIIYKPIRDDHGVADFEIYADIVQHRRLWLIDISHTMNETIWAILTIPP